VIGIVALFTGETTDIIIIAVFGALTLYIISMIALLRLRKKEPDLERPFRVPFYPVAPIVALVIAVLAFIAMTIYNFKLALIYCAIMAGCFALYRIIKK
jgi:ethanolamine permease